MRIVGGRWKGRGLAALGSGDTAAHLRPTADRVRESLFNILEHGDFPPLAEARVLDLFAGTGALGFEALSRGAARALFVDDGVKARALLRDNMDRLGATGIAKIYRRDATRLGQNRAAPYGLIFLDPPYGKGLGERALASARDGDWLAAGAVIVWEEGGDVAVPEWAEPVDTRRQGETVLRFLRIR
ncbi:MAG: 16S rRNA (guanine(966)-N(2))-methyltransferase RsmD [Pseudomonadota bacterium]